MNKNNYTGMQVIKASAGSGKTYTLALRYIEQLLFKRNSEGKLIVRNEPNYHQHILAITFTNKATNEMKVRIIKELYVLSCDPESSDYYGTFKKECTPQAFAALQQEAAKALSAILFDYSSFSVKTIDSFFQSILRSFARELDRDYTYDLQIDGNYAVSVATHNFLLSLGKDSMRTGKNETTAESWIKDHLRQQLSEGKDWNSMFNNNRDDSLAKFAQKINDEFFRSHLPALRQYLTGDDGMSSMRRITSFKKSLNDAAKNYEQLFAETNWNEYVNQAFDKTGLDIKCFNSRKKLYKILSGEKITSLTKAIEEIAKDPASQLAKGVECDAETLKPISDAFNLMVFTKKASELCTNMARNLSYVGLMGEIDKKLEEYRQESNTILIADTNELIGKVVESHKDAPFIYERTGTWINHYMLDEFQDTSRKQYSNFLPLLKESLSHSTDNFDLVIGDSKQAIYRFRNADPSLFRAQINRDFESLHSSTLDTNWRSHRNIIEFNNEFIGKMLELFPGSQTLLETYMPSGATTDYEQKVSSSKDKLPGGMVRVLFNDYNGDELAKVDQVIEMMPRYLHELHERFPWGAINILVNTHGDGKSVIEAVLAYNKAVRAGDIEGSPIPIVSDEMMALTRSTAVRRIIGMLRFIDLTSYVMNQDDDGNEEPELTDDYKQSIRQQANKRRLRTQRQFIALGKFVAAIGNQEFDIPSQAGEILKQCFAEVDEQTGKDTEQQMDHYATMLNHLLPDMRTSMMSLVNIVEHLISIHLADSQRNGDETIYLHALQNHVIDWSSKRNGGTVREFLRHWDTSGDKITVPAADGIDAINVLTIHASKGLEADCVVLPHASWMINQSRDLNYWFTKQEWLDDGGRQLLEHGGVNLDEDTVPPIITMSTSATRALCSKLFSTISGKADEDSLIDNANKTYVAFTRPRKELHIFSVGGWPTYPKSDKKRAGQPRDASEVDFDKDLNRMLHVIVPQLTGFAASTEQAGWYEKGEPYQEPAVAHKAQPARFAEKWDAPVDLPGYTVSTTPVMVSLPNDSDSMREVGKRLHALLSRIGNRNELQQALNYCERRGIISRDENDPWNRRNIEELMQAIHTEPVSTWFDEGNKILNERPLLIVDKDGNKEFKRPDRIVQRPDGHYIIVDYKFGAQHDKRYSKQVNAYIDALRAATGNDNVEGYVWYITSKKTLNVTTQTITEY
ncbi:MAG: UvrD-helicase domain-containing protein [Muribaculaceae bacterium]|nr:UvrD-helicase domain-containing protein [Muribaculaceae bacterium]